jgi:nitrilase
VDQQGGSAIVSPDGKFVAGPLNGGEGIIYAEVEPRQMRGPKWNLDVAGHCARPDVFRLTVSKEDHPVINVAEIPEQKLQDDTEALWD